MVNTSSVLVVCFSINLLVTIILMYRGITKKDKKQNQ